MGFPNWMLEDTGFVRIGWCVTMWVVGVLTVCAALILGITVLDWNVSRTSCNQLSQQTGFPTQYRNMTGCYINPDGHGFVPEGRWVNMTGGK